MKNAIRFFVVSAIIVAPFDMRAQVSANAKSGVSESADPAAIEIKAGKAHEKCLSLDAEQTLQFRFDAPAKLNFYVRSSKSDTQLLKLGETTSASGVFTAKSSESHCLVWENRSEAAVMLTYSSTLVANLPENRGKGTDRGSEKWPEKGPEKGLEKAGGKTKEQ